MALRIGSSNASMPVSQAANPAVMPMATSMPDLNAQPSSGTVDPAVARYLGPEAVCATCIHFMEPSSCEVVSGAIDPQGRCCLHEADAMDMDTDEAADTLDSMPVAEDVVPAEDEEAAY